MKLEINVDGEQFADKFDELIDKLNPEQVQDVMIQVMKNFMGIDPEYNLFKGYLQEESARRVRHSYTGRRTNEEGLDYDAERELNKFKTTRQKMIEHFTETAANAYKERTWALVEEDPILKEMFEQVREKIIKTFPEMVQIAMVTWFAKNMTQVFHDMVTGQTVGQLSEQFGELVTKLQNRYLPDGSSVV